MTRDFAPLAVMCLALTPGILRADDREQPARCSQATLKGTYVLVGAGNGGTVFVVGKITYDGEGNGEGTQTISAGGKIFQRVPVTVTYTVNADCTGSKISNGSSPFDFVIKPDGSRLEFIGTAPGSTFAGSAVRLNSGDQ